MTHLPNAPYLRIAGALKQRIVDGELRVGDRLPSARKLAQEWGVALATVTKAMAVLRHDGLVEARARSGTVVAGDIKPSPSKLRRNTTGAGQAMSRDRIVRAAIDIADREGLEALSMRTVAARLGVATMSPYRLVDSKESLLLLMADAAYGEAPPVAGSSADWRPQLESSARTLWTLYRRHPWLTQINPLTRPLLSPNLLAHAETVLAALETSGLAPLTRLHLHVLLYSYVHGIAIHIERETEAVAATGMTDSAWLDRQAGALSRLVGSGRYPTLAALVTSLAGGYELRLDDLFEFGLRVLLDGFNAQIESNGQ